MEQNALNELLEHYGDSGTGLGKTLTKPMEDMVIYLRKIREVLNPMEFELVVAIMIASLLASSAGNMDDAFKIASRVHTNLMLIDQKISKNMQK